MEAGKPESESDVYSRVSNVDTGCVVDAALCSDNKIAMRPHQWQEAHWRSINVATEQRTPRLFDQHSDLRRSSIVSACFVSTPIMLTE